MQVFHTLGDIGEGAWVRTSTGRTGRVIRVDSEPDPREQAFFNDLEYGDEAWHHVYVVEFLDSWGETYAERWPEDFVDEVTVLDALSG